ncbi:MAG: hypothetical protein LBC92_01605 [Rickettsiales bacterium]|nr:hypothetical protein [Rickettsiales bacterium]
MEVHDTHIFFSSSWIFLAC